MNLGKKNASRQKAIREAIASGRALSGLLLGLAAATTAGGCRKVLPSQPMGRMINVEEAAEAQPAPTPNTVNEAANAPAPESEPPLAGKPAPKPAPEEANKTNEKVVRPLAGLVYLPELLPEEQKPKSDDNAKNEVNGEDIAIDGGFPAD